MLLELKNISKSFASAEGGEALNLLNDVSMSMAAGDTLAITGPSGSGKSTLLNIMGSLERPTSGEVILDGHNLAGLSDEDLAAVRNWKIGFVFQAHHLLPQCTVLENVLVPCVASGAASREQVARARALLERVGLKDRASHRPARLSGGECQRVAVVRALINQPVLLLADEPTGALDHKTSESLAELLIELNREENVSLVLVTHALDLARRMRRIFRLREGTLLKEMPSS